MKKYSTELIPNTIYGYFGGSLQLHSQQSLGLHAGYHGGSPTAVRPSDPALCGSCP